MRLSLLSSAMKSKSMSSGMLGGAPVDSARLRSGSVRSSEARRIVMRVRGVEGADTAEGCREFST